MPDSIVDFIATVHPYDSLKRDELARVATSFSRRTFAPGDLIYQFGDRLPGLYLIESGQVAPVINRVFTLDEVAEAHRLMESSSHIGKIVMRVS